MLRPDYEQCTTAELADSVDRLHGLMCSAQEQLLHVVAAYDRREAWREDGATSTAAWLAYRLAVSHRTGSAWAASAHSLQTLPQLRVAFVEGRLSFDQLAPLATVATSETDGSFAREAPGWSAAHCSAVARRARTVRPEDEAECHRRRSLRWRWDLDARMLPLQGVLPGEAGATVVAALEHIADGYKPDPETGVFEPYERRAADALVELASARLGVQAEPDRATVVIHADTDLHGSIDGGPALGSETIRRQVCDCRVEVIAHGADGTPLGVGRARRTVPAWLTRQVRHRDGGCRFPGCEHRLWGHAHHLRHRVDGGSTDLDNLLWLCPHHHRFVHERRWRIDGAPAGAIRFIRPDGRALETRPRGPTSAPAAETGSAGGRA